MEKQARYPNLTALRTAHRRLLERRRQAGKTPDFLDDVESFIQRGQAAGVLLNSDDDRLNAQNLLDYWANELYHAQRDTADTTLAEFNPDEAPHLPDSFCPYVGLESFSPDKHDYFFGRDPLITEMVARLQENRALMLVGSSGSGKSSAVLAGLLPQLQAGAVPGSENWRYYPPLMPGAAPLANMLRLLQPDQASDPQWVQAETAKLHQSPDYLTRQINQTGPETAVLLIDQFEELFTLCYNDKVRRAFVNNLLHLLQVPAPRHTVILTIRSDFENILVQIPDLYALFEQSQVRVTAMKASELRQAIVKPAEKVGLIFEDGLVDELIHEILGETAALPLLQFTLLKLWENRDRNRVTWAAYHRLGGGRQALANSANDLYNHLVPDEQAAVRQIFVRLMRPDEALKITRVRRLRQDLYKINAAPELIDRALDKLIQARLLRLTEDAASATVQVEIAHETLAQTWPRLIGWLEEDRVARRRRLRLAAMAEEWQARGHDDSTLLRGLLLAEAATYNDLNKIEAAFVAASRQEVHRDQLAREVSQREKLAQTKKLYEEQAQRTEETSRAAVRLRRLAVILAGVFVVAVIAAISATWNNQQARDNAATAVANEQIADSLRATAQASEATAVAGNATASALRRTAQAEANRRATAEADARQQQDAAEQAARAAENASATAVASAAEAETQSRLAAARELAAAALDQLNSDTQLGLLLALEAVNITYAVDQTAPAEAEEALYRALQASQLQLTLSGHTDWVRDVAFSEDGALIATAGLDTAVILWDANTGQKLQTFTAPTRALNSLAFSPNRPHLAAAGDDGIVYVWDWTSGRLIRQLKGEGGTIQDIAYDKDGNRLAAALKNRTVRIWDMTNGEALLHLTLGHDRRVNAVAFIPNSEQLASAGADGRVIFWNLLTGTAVPSDNLPPATANGAPIAINSLAFTPDGTQLATGLDNGDVVVWDNAAHTQLVTLPGHSSFVFSVAFSGDGRFLASAGGDGTAKVWETATRQLAFTLSGHNSAVSAVAFSPDSARLATASQDGTAKVWNTQPALDVITLTGHRAAVNAAVFSGDGRFLATASDDSTVKIWDAASGALRQTLTDPNNAVNDVTFSPDGTWLAAGGADQNGWVWDTATGDLARVFQQHDAPINVVRFHPDGTLLATAGEAGVVRLWSMENGRLSASFNHDAAVQGLAFHPDGDRLASAGDDGLIQIWDIDSGEPIQTLAAHADAVNSIQFSPDGTRLVSAGSDGTAKLWDATSGALLHTFAGHTGAVHSVSFGAGGRLATAGVDRTVKLWDVTSGQLLRTLSGHTSTVNSVFFSPDGAMIATASADRTAQLIRILSLGDLFTLGQNRATRLLNREECTQYLRGEDCLME